MNFRQSLVIAMIANLAGISQAQAKVDEPVRKALALHADGNAADALALLEPLAVERVGDPDFDMAYGIAAADLNQFGIAITALQRVVAAQPDNAQARAELARVYAMVGDAETARQEFGTVLADPTLPDPVRQRFNSIMSTIDQQTGRSSAVTGFVDAEGGYDSNINTATGLTSLTLPLFSFLGPAQLGGGATRTGKPFAQIQGGISGETPLSRRDRLFGSVLGMHRENIDSSAFDQSAITGTAGVAHNFADKGVISLAGQVQQFWLANSAFRTSYGGIAQYSKTLAGNGVLSLSGRYARLDYQNDTARDADRWSGQVAYTDNSLYLTASGGIERTVRPQSRYLGNDFAQAGVTLQQSLGDRTIASLSGAVEYRRYQGNDPLFLGKRQDVQFDLSADLRVAIAKNVSLRPRIAYTRNESRFALYDYDRVTASVALRLEF